MCLVPDLMVYAGIAPVSRKYLSFALYSLY